MSTGSPIVHLCLALTRLWHGQRFALLAHAMAYPIAGPATNPANLSVLDLMFRAESTGSPVQWTALPKEMSQLFPAAQRPAIDVAPRCSPTDLADRCTALDPSFAAVAKLFANYVAAFMICRQESSNHQRAFQLCHDALKEFVNLEFEQSSRADSIPMLKTMIRMSRLLGYRADDESEENGLEAQCRGTMMTFLQSMSRHINNQQSKLPAGIFVLNESFRLVFKSGQYNLCQSFISYCSSKYLDSGCAIPFANLPLFERVSYKYYVGRYYLLYNNIKQARENFEEAFRLCPKSCKSHSRKILLFLTALDLCSGILPRLDFLVVNDLSFFVPLVQAIKAGRICSIRQHLASYEEFYVKRGLYLVMEGSLLIGYKYLLRRVYMALPSAQIRFSYFQIALKLQGEEMDIDEIESILATLIFSRHILGYLSHEQATAVLQKKDSGKNAFVVPDSAIGISR